VKGEYNYDIEKFHELGYQILKGVVPTELTDMIYDEGLRLRRNWDRYSTWQGISCAGRFSENLLEFYREFMPTIARQFFDNDMYYFNDQIVMKIPHDNLSFAPHYDNYYGTNRNGEFQTVNLGVVLNDFTHESGGFEILVDGEWIDLTEQLKCGDVLAIEGNTIHRSHPNESNAPRGIYACVFTEKPMGMKDFYEDKVND